MTKPAHLEPSKLGTKEYWDALYTTELANHAHDPRDTGTAWFDDSDAEAKLVDFLSDAERQQELGLDEARTSFLDLGTGNGALLFALRDAGWEGPMLGVDYSAQSVRFARRIERGRRSGGREEEEEEEGNEDENGNENGNGDGHGHGHGEEDSEEGEVDVHFAEHDILHGPSGPLLSARFSPSVVNGWDVVLDKGTFDAISLSAETLLDTSTATTTTTNTSSSADNTTSDDAAHNNNPEARPPPPPPPKTTTPRRVNETYASRVLPLMREGGLFLITSCNWTEAELRSWFVYDQGDDDDDGGAAIQEIPPTDSKSTERGGERERGTREFFAFEVVGRVEYRSFSFGGVKGQTISSLCFRKVRRSR